MRSRRTRRAPWAILALVVLSACVPRQGIYHEVRPGENLFRIGKAYGLDYRELARINRIPDPSQIEVGQRVFIPTATKRLPVTTITPSGVALGAPPADDVVPEVVLFRWPLTVGTVTSRFGPRAGSFHDGIDVSAALGTPVYAALDGRVVYSDRLRGYGNVVIVDHGNGWATVYAHNSSNLVREGKNVRVGELIARVGDTGRASGPNLHFEVRRRNVAHDPLRYLPRLAAGSQVPSLATSGL